LVQLAPSKGLQRRRQRGGVAFSEATFKLTRDLISDFATLFIDRVPAELSREVMASLLERVAPDAVDEVFDGVSARSTAGVLITRLSKFACRVLPGCTEDTVSEEVARRLNTTTQGAHAWMLRPLLFASPITQRIAFSILESEGEIACRLEGNADEMLRWFPEEPFGIALLTRPLTFEPRRRIEKGCKKVK